MDLDIVLSNKLKVIPNFYRHFPNLHECTQNNSLKLRRGIKTIEVEQITCSENKFGKCLLRFVVKRSCFEKTPIFSSPACISS